MYKRLCRPETLRTGWHLAHRDSRDDFLRDVVGYADFGASLSEHITYVLRDLLAERFQPRHILEVDVPKSGLSVRPGNVLPLPDAMVLHAIVLLIAPRLDKKLSDQVFSYRLASDWEKKISTGKAMFRQAPREIPFLRNVTIRQFDPFESWYDAWPEFDRIRRDAVLSDGYTHLTRTDITAYFENIDLRILENALREALPSEPLLVQLLLRILAAWTRRTEGGTPVGRGIPQGNDVSSFLANIYLLPLDKVLTTFCKRHDATWFRYVDDIDVYTRSADAARAVVFEINESLRSLYLNLQGSKTDILAGRDLVDEHDTRDQLVVDKVWSGLERMNCRAKLNAKNVTALLRDLRPLTKRFRRGLPASVQSLGKTDNRLLRRLMTCYGRAGRPYLKNVALACLTELPELRVLDKSLRYLGHLDYRLHRELVVEMLEMLEGGTFPLPYQSARVIEQIGIMHPHVLPSIASRVRKYALDSKRNWMVRQKAGETIAVYPYREDHAWSVAEKLLDDPEPWVRRAGLVLLTRAKVQTVRDRLQDLTYHPDPPLSELVLYYERHLRDDGFAEEQLSVLRKGNQSDLSLSRKVTLWWLVSCSPSKLVVRYLRRYLESVNSRSARICWHRDRLLTRTKWVVDHVK